MICLRCGQECRGSETFCPACGSPLRLPCANSGGTATGLDKNVAGLLCYLLWWISGLVLYFIESEKYVRYHAVQSILTFGAISVLFAVLNLIKIILETFFWRVGLVFIFLYFYNIITSLIWIGALILWVILMVKAYQGETYRLPLAGSIAERQLE